MRKLALFVMLLLPCGLPGAAIVPPCCFCPNVYPGYCAWSSLAMACRAQNIRAGINLVDEQMKRSDYVDVAGTVWPRNLGYDWAIKQELSARHIPFRINLHGECTEAGRDLIRVAVNSGRGAVVSFNVAPTTRSAHAVLVTDFNEETFTYIDPNDGEHAYKGSRAWFDQNWMGLVVVLGDDQ